MQTDSAVSLFDVRTLDDPYPRYDQLRRHAPVYAVPDSDFYLVSTWEAVQEAMSRTSDFSSNLTAALIHDGSTLRTFDLDRIGSARHVLATADDPWHAVERKLVLPALVAKRIRALEPAVTSAAERLWHTGRHGRHIEWMSAIGDRLPMTVVAWLIGLPTDDVPQLVEWGYRSTELLSGVNAPGRLPVIADSAIRLAAYLRDRLEESRRDPGDDILGDLARAVDAAVISDEVATLMLLQLVGAGGESTAGLVGNAVRLLAEHRGLQTAVRRDSGLIPALLEETLRLESPFRAHHRHVATDTSLAGVALPEGSHLLLLWGAANRDPTAFDQPDAVRLDRPNPRGHLAFGRGVHFCVGAALARVEARIAVQLLLSTTQWFGVVQAEWVRSITVRRHRRLLLELDF